MLLGNCFGDWMGRSTGRDRHKQALNRSGHTLLVPKRKWMRAHCEQRLLVASGVFWNEMV